MNYKELIELNKYSFGVSTPNIRCVTNANPIHVTKDLALNKFLYVGDNVRCYCDVTFGSGDVGKFYFNSFVCCADFFQGIETSLDVVVYTFDDPVNKPVGLDTTMIYYDGMSDNIISQKTAFNTDNVCVPLDLHLNRNFMSVDYVANLTRIFILDYPQSKLMTL